MKHITGKRWKRKRAEGSTFCLFGIPPSLQEWVSPPLQHPSSYLRADTDTHTLSHSPSGVWLSMPLSVLFASTPHPPSLPHKNRASVFPICHPRLSSQHCLPSKVLVIDCYCKVGLAPWYWISNDCIKPWCSCGQWQLFGYSAVFVAASWLKRSHHGQLILSCWITGWFIPPSLSNGQCFG